MKPHKIVLFFLALFALMFACWYFFPAEGVDVGGVKLRFPSYEKALEDLRNGDSAVDVDSVLLAVQKSYEMVREQGDTLAFYKEYITSNPNRIHLPGDDYTFFDSFFEAIAHEIAHGLHTESPLFSPAVPRKYGIPAAFSSTRTARNRTRTRKNRTRNESETPPCAE